MSEEQPKCPVDHSTREIWLQKHKKQEEEKSKIDEKCPVDETARSTWLSNMKQTTTAPEAIEVPITAPEAGCTSEALNNEYKPVTSDPSLPIEREISSIPRTGADGNWIYPSQKQFFDAMQRKNWSPEKQDMKTVVPIHNAVNEKAWSHILMWENGYGGELCGGIKLTSFKGDSKKLTPRAMFNSYFGYEKPFDRHDWTINRCGKDIDYVIDFYGGKQNPENPQAASFYLDVRPKLNSFEGVKLRIFKALGL